MVHLLDPVTRSAASRAAASLVSMAEIATVAQVKRGWKPSPLCGDPARSSRQPVRQGQVRSMWSRRTAYAAGPPFSTAR